MTIRTTRSRITFASPFVVRGVDGTQPAGAYDVEIEEEVIEGHLHTVYQRMATILYVKRDGTTVSYMVDPRALAEAQRQDHKQSLDQGRIRRGHSEVCDG